MASRRQSPAPKRTLAIKRADGEPLDRADIQYDVLNGIFSDPTLAFTDPYVQDDAEDKPKLSFHDLYIKALLHSTKASKAWKDKITESPEFAQDFAMLALLVNVGRINTTMSFFPEMKTPIRTYHPIPSLSRTGGNLQDAPRIRHILKAGMLEDEASSPPQTPEDVLARARSGHIPSTSVLNLMSVLSTHSTLIAAHFSQRFDFLDVFLKNEFSSSSRARVFLWLCFNYLENPGSASDDYDAEEIPNPFGEANKSTAPVLIALSTEDMLLENIDTPEEKALSEKMVANRDQIVKQNAAKGEKANKVEPNEEDTQAIVIVSGDEAKPATTTTARGRKKAVRHPPAAAAAAAAEKPKRGSAKKVAGEKAQSRKSKLKSEAQGSNSTPSSSVHPDDISVEDEVHIDAAFHGRTNETRLSHAPDTANGNTASGFRILTGLTSESKASRSRPHRYSPYQRKPEDLAISPRPLRPVVSQRTMLQYAWEMINTTDPLVDSDNDAVDDGDHYEYAQRLKVVSGLAERRWKEPSRTFQSNHEMNGN